MILSFHPVIEADENVICAGRPPGPGDLEAISRAQAVILPQGCTEALYRMARANCPHVFPNMGTRFDYPGKSGQIRLFRELAVAHPETVRFNNVGAFQRQRVPFVLPWVVKLNWGGQGEGVWPVSTEKDITRILVKLIAWENTGQQGFLIQRQIDTRRRTLRVVVIGDWGLTYWRNQSPSQPFGTGVAHGAGIDYEADPHLQQNARSVARHICHCTQLQLAGFDFIFSESDLRLGKVNPLVLEINYFFGRTGLGGSQRYYQILTAEVDRWLAGLGLARRPFPKTDNNSR